MANNRKRAKASAGLAAALSVGEIIWQEYGSPSLGIFVALLVLMGALLAYSILQYGWVASANTRSRKVARCCLALVAVLGIPTCLGLLFWPTNAQKALPTTQESRLEITNIVGVPVTNSKRHSTGFMLSVYYANEGNIAATCMVHRTIIVPSENPLTPAEERQYWKIAGAVPPPSNQNEEIQPGLAPKHLFSVPQEDDEIEQLGRTAKEVLAGRKRLYVFIAMKYRDRSLPDNQVRVNEICGWFINSFDLWHNCGDRTYISRVVHISQQ